MTELERRVAVEEIWAQRIVMEPVRNAERMWEYNAVKPLWRCEPEIKVVSRVIAKPTNVTKISFLTGKRDFRTGGWTP